MKIATTTYPYVFLHLKAVIDRLKAIEQSTLTTRERNVLREHLDRTYDRAAALLPPDLLQTEARTEEFRPACHLACH